MLTIDDKRVHFSRVYEEDGVHREYEEEEDSRQRLQFCYHVWIGDGAWDPRRAYAFGQPGNMELLPKKRNCYKMQLMH